MAIVAVDEAVHRVERSRSGCNHDHAEVTPRSCIAVRFEERARFLPRHNEAKASSAFLELVKEGDETTPRDTEDRVDAFELEIIEEERRTGWLVGRRKERRRRR